MVHSQKLNERPVIGVTGPTQGGLAAWRFIQLAVNRAGGEAMRMTPEVHCFEERIDGMIFSGGTDIFPYHYGGDDLELDEYDHARDLFEMQWFARADAAEIPMLGICRGAQLMNVCRGGTLYADIKLVHEEAHYPSSLLGKVVNRKWVHLRGASRLRAILDCDPCRVNSLHHQSVNATGKGLIVTAQEKNGIIQAIEDPSRPYMVGVQWHPEFMPHVPRQQRLFAELVAQARAFRARAAQENTLEQPHDLTA